MAGRGEKEEAVKRGTPVGDLLREIREEFGLSKTEMVRLLQLHGLPGTTFATYSAWEAGSVRPKPVSAEALRRALPKIRKTLARRQEAVS